MGDEMCGRADAEDRAKDAAPRRCRSGLDLDDDFYLTGQRLGDLRRYPKAGTDLFPTGKFPVLPDPYGTIHCFIVPLSENAPASCWLGRRLASEVGESC